MPITKSVKKNVRIAKKRTQVNRSRKSKIKTFFNKVIEAIKEKNAKKAMEAFKEFESQLMKGVTKGVYKKNTASRKLRRTADKIRKVKGGKKVATKPAKKVTKTVKVAKEAKKAPKTAKATKVVKKTKKTEDSKK